MRTLVFAPLAVLLCVVFLTAYFFHPPLSNEPSLPPLPAITDGEAKASYGPETSKGKGLIKKGDEFLVSIQNVCAELRLTYAGPSQLAPDSLTISAYSFWREGQVCTVVTYHSDDLELRFLANNETVLSYWNYALENQHLKRPYYEPAEKPELTKEQASHIARRFLDICNDNRVPLDAPDASFDYDGSKPTKTGMSVEEGVWRVRWTRLDGEGNPFQSVARTVCFAEGDCPMFVSSELDPPYHKEPGPIISQSAAEQRARIAMAGDGMRYGALHLEKGKSILCICQPMKNVWRLDSGLEDEARLAYDVWFSCELLKPNGEKSYWQTRMITIDAHKGSVIRRDEMSGIGENE